MAHMCANINTSVCRKAANDRISVWSNIQPYRRMIPGRNYSMKSMNFTVVQIYYKIELINEKTCMLNKK